MASRTGRGRLPPKSELAATVEQSGRDYERPGPDIVDQLAEELLRPGGRLAAEKTFDLLDAVVAVAPLLHGLPVSMLDNAVQKVISDERAVALPPIVGARGPVWATACVLEDEQRVAELADKLAERSAPPVPPQMANKAVRGSQTELGRGARLNESQAEVAKALPLTSGHSFDVLIGVAGSGKTSTLAAVRAGFEAAGYTVLGAATSGQAARALEEGAGVQLADCGLAHLAARPPAPGPQPSPCAGRGLMSTPELCRARPWAQPGAAGHGGRQARHNWRGTRHNYRLSKKLSNWVGSGRWRARPGPI